MFRDKARKFFAKIFHFLFPKLRNSTVESSKNPPGTSFPKLSTHFVLLGMLAKKDRLRIIQIGANDGKINDPIYDFVIKFHDKTDIILLEPQVNVAQQLIQNYSKHESSKVIVKAIGDGQEISLYSIKPEAWSATNAPYAKSWPEGRAQTGIVSSNRQHVVKWLLDFGDFDENSVDDAIAKESYQTTTFAEITEANPEFRDLDVLQIDIEGSDHLAVIAALNSGLRPSIINFESANIAPEELNRCNTLLTSLGYEMFSSKNSLDTLCVRVEA